MTASPIANPTEQPDECICPPVAVRSALDAVDVALLTERAARLRLPVPHNVIGAEVPEDACPSAP